MEKILTFIIPSYNVEKYLDKCLRSLIDEKILNDIEVIVVNDGSTDSTLSIAQFYEKKYPDVFKVIDKENGGHGSTINYGIQAASGKYVKVVDADDWVVTKNLDIFIKQLKNIDADVILNHYYTVNIGNRRKESHKIGQTSYGKIHTMDMIMDEFDKYDDCLCFHGITYYREFYLSCGIELTEHVFYEDNEYVTFPFYKAKSICPLDLHLYIYRIGDIEQSVSIQNKIKRMDHEERVIRNMLNFYATHTMISSNERYMEMKIIRVLASYWIICFLCHPNRRLGKNAGNQMYQLLDLYPDIKKAARKRFVILKIMNIFHMNKNVLDKFIKFMRRRK